MCYQISFLIESNYISLLGVEFQCLHVLSFNTTDLMSFNVITHFNSCFVGELWKKCKNLRDNFSKCLKSRERKKNKIRDKTIHVT